MTRPHHARSPTSRTAQLLADLHRRHDRTPPPRLRAMALAGGRVRLERLARLAHSRAWDLIARDALIAAARARSQMVASTVVKEVAALRVHGRALAAARCHGLRARGSREP